MTNLPVKASLSLKFPSSKGVSCGPKMINLPVKASVSQSAILEGSIVWTINDQLTGKGERKSEGSILEGSIMWTENDGVPLHQISFRRRARNP